MEKKAKVNLLDSESKEKNGEIDPDEKLPNIDKTISDVAIDALKTGLGPLSGFLVGPLVEGIINMRPSRMDRISTFVKILHANLDKVANELIKHQLTNNNFQILFEECFTEAMKSASIERHEYLASILKEGINADHQEIYRFRHLLQILSELNDEEILQLKYYSFRYTDNSGFVKIHPNTIPRILATPHPDTSEAKFGAELGNHTFQKSYLNHLSRLDLLKIIYKREDLDLPDFPAYKGPFFEHEISHYQITDLGILLLMLIGILEEEPRFGLKHAIKII